MSVRRNRTLSSPRRKPRPKPKPRAAAEAKAKADAGKRKPKRQQPLLPRRSHHQTNPANDDLKMFTALDQIFVNALHWLMRFVPEALHPLVSPLICIAFILMVFPAFFSIVTIFERKGIGRIQNRYGPNRVGIPFTKIRLAGFGQFLPDGLKMLTKEDIVPRAADKVVHFLAPVVMRSSQCCWPTQFCRLAAT